MGLVRGRCSKCGHHGLLARRGSHYLCHRCWAPRLARRSYPRCRLCLRLEPHGGRGLCRRCYHREYLRRKPAPVPSLYRVPMRPRTPEDEAEIARRLSVYEARAAQHLPLFEEVSA